VKLEVGRKLEGCHIHERKNGFQQKKIRVMTKGFRV
jgi:hypothetical protein